MMGLAGRTGSLEVGKRFDAIVLSGNVRTVPVTDLHTLTVRATYLAGTRVS